MGVDCSRILEASVFKDVKVHVKLANERCYLCGISLRIYDLKPGEKPPADSKTRDHVPPVGLFPDPKPSDLVTVPCCFKCNNTHSGFDERLRALAALPFDRNSAGNLILTEKVIKRTFANARQADFVKSIVNSMHQLPGSDLIRMRIPADEFRAGAVRITKGLLAFLHKGLDYYGSHFYVEPISPEPFDAQLRLMAMLRQGQHFQRGERVFQCWYHVEQKRSAGYWMLLFYECFGFFVSHANDPEGFHRWQKSRGFE